MSFPGFSPSSDLLYWFDVSSRIVYVLSRRLLSPQPVSSRLRWPSEFPSDFEFSRWHRLMSTNPSGPSTGSSGTSVPDSSGRVVFVYRVNSRVTLSAGGTLTFGPNSGSLLRTTGPHHSFIDHTDIVWTATLNSFTVGQFLDSSNELWSLQPIDTAGSSPVSFLRRETLNRALP